MPNGLPNEPWSPVPNRVLDQLVKGKLTQDLRLEIWAWEHMARRSQKTLPPGVVTGLRVEDVMRIVGVKDKRNASHVRAKAVAAMGLIPWKDKDGDYQQGNPHTLRDTPKTDSSTPPENTENANEFEDLSGGQDTPGTHPPRAGEHTHEDTRIGSNSSTDGLPDASARVQEGTEQEKARVRNAEPPAPCDASPSASKETSTGLRPVPPSAKPAQEIQEPGKDPVSNPGEAFPAGDSPYLDLTTGMLLDPKTGTYSVCPAPDIRPPKLAENPAEPEPTQPYQDPDPQEPRSGTGVFHQEEPLVLEEPSPADQSAQALLALYNETATPAFPELFPAVAPESPNGRDILGRLSRLLAVEPGLQEDLKALIQVLPHDGFYRGASQKQHIWNLRFIALQKPSRIREHGAKARRLLEARAKSNLAQAQAAPEPPNRRPAHRREADHHNLQQMIAAYGE